MQSLKLSAAVSRFEYKRGYNVGNANTYEYPGHIRIKYVDDLFVYDYGDQKEEQRGTQENSVKPLRF